MLKELERNDIKFENNLKQAACVHDTKAKLFSWNDCLSPYVQYVPHVARRAWSPATPAAGAGAARFLGGLWEKDAQSPMDEPV